MALHLAIHRGDCIHVRAGHSRLFRQVPDQREVVIDPRSDVGYRGALVEAMTELLAVLSEHRARAIARYALGTEPHAVARARGHAREHRDTGIDCMYRLFNCDD